MQAGPTTFNHLFKIVNIGDSGVGKSALLLRFSQNTFSDNHYTTIGVDFRMKLVQTSKSTIKLQLWDTAGQQRYRTITNTYYKGAHGIVITYDISNRHSFEHVENWISEVVQYCNDNFSVIIVGNKIDLENDRKVSTEEGMDLAQKHGFLFMEASAKTGLNVQNAFMTLVEHIESKIGEEKKDTKSQEKVKPIEQKVQEKKVQEKKIEGKKEEDKHQVQMHQKKSDNLYELLSANGVSDVTIQILQAEEIKTLKELNYLKDEDLKQLGIKLGEIARIRSIQ